MTEEEFNQELEKSNKVLSGLVQKSDIDIQIEQSMGKINSLASELKGGPGSGRKPGSGGGESGSSGKRTNQLIHPHEMGSFSQIHGKDAEAGLQQMRQSSNPKTKELANKLHEANQIHQKVHQDWHNADKEAHSKGENLSKESGMAHAKAAHESLTNQVNAINSLKEHLFKKKS